MGAETRSTARLKKRKEVVVLEKRGDFGTDEAIKRLGHAANICNGSDIIEARKARFLEKGDDESCLPILRIGTGGKESIVISVAEGGDFG